MTTSSPFSTFRIGILTLSFCVVVVGLTLASVCERQGSGKEETGAPIGGRTRANVHLELAFRVSPLKKA